MGATIYDVAQRAGVSISTVSLALNAPRRVRAATLERVLQAIDELQFVPKPEAVTRARRGVGRIGVLAPFTTYASFARRLNGVLQATRDQSCEVVVYDQESAATSTLASLPLTQRLDGLIVMSIPFGEEIADRLASQNVATVLLELERPGFSSVTIDDVAGGRMAAKHLLDRGHRRFGFIGERHRQEHGLLLQSDARLNGFREELASAGVELPEENVRHVDHTIAAALAAAEELLALEAVPTAVFAHDDVLAAAVLRAARGRGLRIPEDIAVIGFDDSDIAEHVGLTSIGQPLEESGRVAAETLLSELADGNRSLQHITLRLTLVERETT
jgi:DNA-binding LacI/PurR family transcriptional regulator